MKIPLTILASKESVTLDVEFVYPPIPDRSMDWSAVDYNTYDGASETNEVGRGPTRQEAIQDWLEKTED